ncbi:MAG TPA: ABC transporter ATP-binding protein [Gemmatimonadaceae bacterium]|nr:ABC transporter ATP-binding protein [Gemmatimonadaceae bacterium]
MPPRYSTAEVPVYGSPSPSSGTTPAAKKTLRERIQSLRYFPQLIKLIWSTSPVLSVLMIILRLARSLTPLFELYIARLIVDTVVGSRLHGADWPLLVHLFLSAIAIAIASDLLARGSILVESLMGDLFANKTSVRIMEHAATLDLAQFENPEFYDLLERARRESTGRITLFSQALAMAQDVVTLITLSSAMIVFNPWLLLLLAGTVLPSFIGETHFAGLGYSLLFRWTPQRRLLEYLRFVGASDRTAKEVQMFGLAPWLTERYRALAQQFYEENRSLSQKRAAVSAALSLLGTFGYYSAYGLIIYDTVRGLVTIGTMTFLAASFSQSRDIIQRLLLTATEVYQQVLYLRDLFLFLEIKPTIINQQDARPVPRPIREGFVFEDVGFQYPGTERWSLRHVSFTLRPGERLALVGENGAGKTTLTKLIARLYDPTEGRVWLDGVDLREYDVAELRQAIGVIFQDFVRYDMRFDENIGVGRIDQTEDYLKHAVASENGAAPPVPPKIESAAHDSLADTLLPRLPKGYAQMLGRRFEDGVDLSGGEWQKVALARAYLRDAQLLILDEPTAALDARAEYEVFERFSELTRGRMAILISHRFSTVRMADRILVLSKAHLVEQGTHEELVAKGGLYSELFTMQAAGYR